MKRFILALALTLPLFAGDSLVLTSGDSLSYDPPNTTPWTALDTRRVEMAIDFTDWNCAGSTTTRLWGMGIDLYLGCGPTATALYMRDGSRTWILDVSGRGESLIRFSRDVSGSITPVTYPSDWLEIWDADGSDYGYAGANTAILQGTPENLTTENASGAQSIGGTGINAQIHWVKQYSTVIWPGPSSPLPGTRGTGDLGDWSFDGSTLTDASGLGMTISGSGHTFETTPSINPTPDLDAGEANWVDAPTVRAGEEVELAGTCSTVASTLGCTCVWSDQGGGSSGIDEIQFIGSTTSCDTTAVFPTFGSYTLRLATTDNDANTGTYDFEIGAVAQDSTKHIVYPTANIDLIVGPQLAFGNSVWPWFEERRQTIGNWMGDRIPQPDEIGSNTVDWGQAGAGTVSVTNGSPTITGSGTDFQNDYCSGGSSNTSTYGVLLIDDAGLAWRMPISSCNSATSITATANWNRTSDSGLSYLKAVNYGDWTANGSEAQNFYDNCLAYGAMYYATGLSNWLTLHNTCSSIWWDFPMINRGQCREGPTAGIQCAVSNTGMQSMTGLMLWAEINGTQAAIWDGLEEIEAYNYGTWGNRTTPSTDIRPSGYALAWEGLGAALDPDETRQGVYESNVDFMLADLFSADQQHPDGAFEHSSNNGLAGTGTVNVTNGSPTVTCATTCNFSEGTHEGMYFHAIAVPADRFSRANGRRDEILIESVDSSTQITLASNYTGPTTSGIVWRYAQLSHRIMQPFIQAMPMAGFAWLNESGYYDGRQRIVDTLNYNRTRGYRPHTGGFYSLMDDAGCQASIVTDTTNSAFDCQFTADSSTTDFSGSRYLFQEPMRASAWAAKYARDLDDSNKTALVAFVDTMFGHTFGKWGGPEADYDNSTCSTCYALELDDGQTTFTSGTDPYKGKNKNWGFGFGFGGSYVWDALRTNEPETEDLVSFSVPLDIGSVGSATKASVTLYEPKGGVSRTVDDQTGSTASVTGDARQGGHLAKIEYKDGGGGVLQTDWEMVAAPVGSNQAAVQIEGSATLAGTAALD